MSFHRLSSLHKDTQWCLVGFYSYWQMSKTLRAFEEEGGLPMWIAMAVT